MLMYMLAGFVVGVVFALVVLMCIANLYVHELDETHELDVDIEGETRL